MAKTLKEAQLTTRNARQKLLAGVHWRGIDPDVHLGYRKGKRGGVWLVRWRNGAGYRQDGLGTADDEIAEGTLAYADAVKAARERVGSARRDAQASADGPAQTVRSAVLAYMVERDARESGRKGRLVRSDATHRLERYVIGKDTRGRRQPATSAPLAEIALHELNESHLLAWRDALPPELKGTTRQRLVNDLKAALNGACTAYRHKLPGTLPTIIKHGLAAVISADQVAEPVARESQILTDATVGEIIAAARAVDDDKHLDGDFYRLVVVLAATGARFSQVVRLRVGDVQPDKSRLMMPVSRKGRGGKSGATPVLIGQDVLDALQPAIAKRGRNELLLMRWRYEQEPGSIRWIKAERAAWGAPAEIVRSWAAIRKLVGLETSVVPYALRHSSIVRGIRAGLPIHLVASLHNTSVAMIERHYGRWIADGLEDLAARAVVRLVPPVPSKAAA
jgi:integrase